MDVPKLLRIALFSVLALVLTVGLAVSPAQAQSFDASVTVDPSVDDNINARLSDLDDAVAGASGTTGELRILADNYEANGEISLDADDFGDGSSRDALEDLTITAVNNNGNTTVTIESIEYEANDSGNGLTNVTVRSDGANLRLTTNSANSSDALRLNGGGTDGTFDVASSGVLRIDDGLQVERDNEISITGEQIEYRGNGTADLTFVTDGNDISADQELPRTSGEIGTLELDEGTGTNGTVTFSNFGFSVNTIQDGDTDAGETGTSFTVEGNLTIDSGGLAGDDETEEATVQGDFTVNGGGVSSLSSLAVEDGGNLDVTGQLGVGDGTFTVATGGTATVTAVAVSVNPVIDVAGGSFDTNGGSLTVTDNGSGNAIQVTDSGSETTLDAGATTISGSANSIFVDGSNGNGAIVTLGDVTFDVPFDGSTAFSNTAFNLTGANADVTVEDVTIDVLGDDKNANKGTLVTGGGSFTSPGGVELTPADLEDVSTTDGDVVDLDVDVTESSADFDIGSVTANSATDSDNGNEVSTALDIDAVGTSGDDIAGEVTAGGTVRNLTNAFAEDGGTNDAGGTITLTGGTVTGQLVNAAADNASSDAFAGGTVNVTGNVTYSSDINVTNFANDGGSDANGQIDVQGTGTELLITGNADVVNNGTNGVTGQGLLAFNSDGNDLTVKANGGNVLPEVETRSDLSSLDIEGSDGNSLDIGPLTANASVTVNSNDADATDVTVDGNLDANAQVDFNTDGATANLDNINVNGALTADAPVNFGFSNNSDDIGTEVDIGGKLTANDAVTFGASSGSYTISTSDVEANANVDFGSGADQLDVGGELLVDNATTTITGLSTEAQDVTIDGETDGDNAKLDLGNEELVVTRDFARRGGAANADFATSGSATLKIGGTTAESTVQSPVDRLRVDGNLEFEKEAAEGDAPITVQDVVRVSGNVTVIEPTNSLAFTEVTFEENLIVDNGTFSVTRNSGSSSLETSGAAVVFRNGADVDPGTEGLTINGDILSRDDGERTDISGSAALNVTGTIEMRSGGFNVTSGASLNPGNRVIRFITDQTSGGPSTQIVGSGDFNPNDNTYDLEYRGSGSEQNTGTELDDGNVANLDVGPPNRETGQLPGTEIGLAGSPEITGALTVRSGARINDDGVADRTITLSAAQTTHDVTGTVEGANRDVTLRVEGEESSVEGTTEEEAATIESLVAAASEVEVTNIHDVTGSIDVLANFDDGGTTVEPSLTLTLAEDPVGGNPGQTVDGDIDAKNPLTLGSAVEASTSGNVEVLAAESGENGTLNFGGFDLTLSNTSVTFTSESEATFNAPNGGTLLFSDAADVNAGGATIPNVTFDGGVTVGENATVSNSLKINTGITLDGDPAELTFQGDATLAGDVTTAGTGPEALIADGGALTVSGGDRTVEEYEAASGTDGEARVELPENETNALTFDKRFEIASGDFTHAAEVIVDAKNNAIDFNTGTDAGSISQEGGNDLVLDGTNNSITFDLAGPLTADRVSVEGDNVAYGDTENFTVSRLDLNQAFNFDGGDGSLVIADGGTVIRDSDNDVLDEALSFAGSEDTYDLEYTSDDPGTSGREFATAGRVETLDVNISNSNTLTLDDTDVGTDAQVNTEIKLTEGTVEHGDASNSERQLALNENGTLIQQDGELDGTIQVNGSEAYTLRYQPTDSDINTSGDEFLDQSSDPSIALQLRAEDPDNPDDNNITLDADRSVASFSADRQSSSSLFDLGGNTLTVDGKTTVSSGEVRNGSGDLAEIDGQGFTVEGGKIDSDENGGVALTSSSGTFEVTDGEVEGPTSIENPIDADGAFEATGGTLDGISLAAAGDAEITGDAIIEENGATNNDAGEVTIEFDGSGNQNFKVEGDETIDNISIKQSGSTVTVSDVSNSNTEVSVAGTLTLENGILVSNEQDVAEGENPVEFNLTGGTIERDVADGGASHIAGPVTQTVGTGSGAEALYPVGTADGTYRQFRLFFPNGLSSNTDVTVEHENQDPEGTSGFPLTSNFSDGSQGTFNLSQDYPSYYWRVETGSPTSLQQDYEVSARADGFEFGPGGADEDDESQFRIIRRTDTDPQQADSDWSLVGDGTNYDNLLRGNTSLDTRVTAATQSLNTKGSRFTVTSPQKPKPVIATNNTLPVTVGSQSTTITQSDLETTDSDNTPSELTYTVTTAPSQGNLQLSGSDVGQGGTFTQQDINNGNVVYSHTASAVDDDNFEFEVSDNAGQTESGTFNIDVQAVPTIATNGGLTLTQGGEVPVQTGDLETTDADNAASELTYTVTTPPSQGELQLNGSAVGQSGTFTQQDISDGNVEYNHTASVVDDDQFTFDVEDADGNSVTGTTVNVAVNAAEFAISGTVVHPRTDGDSDPVEGATVTITDSDGNVVTTAETGTDGSYSADVTEGDFTVEVTAVDGVPETSNDGRDLSVDATDAFIAQDNFLSGGGTLSSIQTVVGDVTGVEDEVNTTDAFDIQSYFLGNDQLDVGVLFGGTASVDVSGGDETGTQLEAVAFGDINLDGDLNGAADGSGTQTTAALSASTAGETGVSLSGSGSDAETAASAATSNAVTGDAATTFEVPVRLDRSAELGAFDLAVSYDSEKATLQGVSAPNAEVASSSKDGTVRLAWFDEEGGQDPLTVGDGGKLVTLTFKADADVKKGETFELKDIEGQLTGPNAESLSGVGVTVPRVSFGIERPDEFALGGNAPNPFQRRTTLSVQMPENGSATVSVYNTLGQKVKEIQANLAAGDDQRIRVDGSGLSSGVYMYRVEVEMESKTIQRSGRMTLVK